MSWPLLIVAAVLLVTNLWLSYFLFWEHQHRLADNDRSQKCLTWWRHYAQQMRRERKA